jgi:hypothetical protein
MLKAGSEQCEREFWWGPGIDCLMLSCMISWRSHCRCSMGGIRHDQNGLASAYLPKLYLYVNMIN